MGGALSSVGSIGRVDRQYGVESRAARCSCACRECMLGVACRFSCVCRLVRASRSRSSVGRGEEWGGRRGRTAGHRMSKARGEDKSQHINEQAHAIETNKKSMQVRVYRDDIARQLVVWMVVQNGSNRFSKPFLFCSSAALWASPSATDQYIVRCAGICAFSISLCSFVSFARLPLS
jgi:hypothetical protein